jgi:hypothetical protein
VRIFFHVRHDFGCNGFYHGPFDPFDVLGLELDL